MFKQVIKANQIETLPANLTLMQLPHKFFHTSLLAGLQFYQDDAGLEYIAFFNSLFFVLAKGTDTQTVDLKIRHQGQVKSPLKSFCFYQAAVDESDEQVSQILRGSKTLQLDQLNTYAAQDVKAVFAEKGAWIYERFSNGQFERFVLLYLLAQVYNLHSERQLEQVAAAYDSKQLSKMREFKEASLAFDVKYYFANPVLIDRHQARTVWRLLATLFEVAQLHDEVKSQIQDLSDAIASQLQTRQEDRYKRWEVIFWIVGVVLAVLALLPAEWI